MTIKKRVGAILGLLAVLVILVFGVCVVGSDLIALFKMEDRVQSSWGMFFIVFSSPFFLYVILFVIYLWMNYKPEELEKSRKKKKSITLNGQIMGFFLAIAVFGFVGSIPLSWYIHFRLLDIGYVICESKFGKGSTRYAKEKRLCH
ncbi:membrane protein [Xenorhabdus stockiae]|uniref:Membrane protein n=1 Tax=Xenorhabdus stockiae TaxID=351614 RepID=A0A2D0KQI5_9GAMM|nr:DUF1240 domain-containing protein [Xenorhabdus stockiae]PHM65694.1 membrane protein [Xenorhabdus stockiae]